MPSKKKQRNHAKAKKSIGHKAAQKAKGRDLIRNREALKESKKEAKKRTAEGDDDNEEVTQSEEARLKEIESVDELFKNSFFQEDDAKSEAGSESSDDAFVDIGTGGADEPETMDVDQNENEASMHADELKALKESDPSFYEYLMQNEKHLLDFSAEDPEQEDDMEVEDEEKPVQGPSTVLTPARFKALTKSVEENDSLHAFRIIIAAFKGAVREAEDKTTDAEVEVVQKPKKKKITTLRVEDPEVYSELLLWVFSNVARLMEKLAGDKGSNGCDAKKYSKWRRVQALYRTIWGEFMYVINSFTGFDTLEPLLRACGTVECLKFLWPFDKLRQNFIKRTMYLWANSSSQSVRLMAFMLLRNAAGLAQRLAKNSEEESKALEALVRAMYKEFADLAARVKSAVNWGTMSRFRFLENCMVELLRIDGHMAYRVGYTCIRQLALMLRNAIQYTSKAGQKKKTSDDPMHVVYGWSFLRGLSLWSHAVAQIKPLEPLVYPVVMLATTALKTKINMIDYLPYCFHVVMLLNDIAAGSQKFIPVSSYLLKILDHVVPLAEKQKHNTRVKQNEAVSKLLDLDLLVKLPKGGSDFQGLSSCCHKAIYLLTDHLGLIARSPAFPEISAPVVAHMKKVVKNCAVDVARQDLKTLIDLCDKTLAVVTSKRESLDDSASFLVFGHEMPLAAKREQQRKLKAAEEVQKTKSVVKQTTTKTETTLDDEEAEMKKLSKKQKKKLKQIQKTAQKLDTVKTDRKSVV